MVETDPKPQDPAEPQATPEPSESKPETTETPPQPEMPTPPEPEVPAAPEAPATPEAPETPAEPPQPEVPAAPAPETPSEPAQTEVADTPPAPAAPESPAPTAEQAAASAEPKEEKLEEGELSEAEMAAYDIAPDEKLWSAIGYVSFLCILTLIIKKDSEYCKFHGRQALILAIIFAFTKFFWMIRYTFPIFAFIELVIIIIGALRAYSGTWWKIPGIYGLAKGLKF